MQLRSKDKNQGQKFSYKLLTDPVKSTSFSNKRKIGKLSSQIKLYINEPELIIIEIIDLKTNVTNSKKIEKSDSKNVQNNNQKVIVRLSSFSSEKNDQNFKNTSSKQKLEDHLNQENDIRRSSRIKKTKKSQYVEQITIDSDENPIKLKKVKTEQIKGNESKEIQQSIPILISLQNPSKGFAKEIIKEDFLELNEEIKDKLNSMNQIPEFNRFENIQFQHKFENSEIFKGGLSQEFFKEKSQCENNELGISNLNFPQSKNREIKLIDSNSETNSDYESIFIIDNANQKMSINVHKYFLSTKSIAKIPNPFYKDYREEFFNSTQFTRDFRIGYSPINLQAQENNQADKYHFIRKKQSCANVSLKRTGGVSYVKPTESKQLHVGKIYQPLSHLVFQCSTGCDILENYISQLEELSETLLLSGEANLVAYFECEEEEVMREYILFPHKRLSIAKRKYFFIESFEDLWSLLQDKFFICLHFKYHPKYLVQSFSQWAQEKEFKNFSHMNISEFVIESDLMIGILIRKSISGKKAFSKTIYEEFEPKNFKVDINSILSPASTKISRKSSNISPLINLKEFTRNLEVKEEDYKGSEKLFENPDFKSLPCYPKIMNQISEFFDLKYQDSIITEKNITETSVEAESKGNSKNPFVLSDDSVSSEGDELTRKKLEYLKNLWKDPSNKVNTLSLRYEIYVQKEKWESSSKNIKNLLNTFSLVSKDCLEKHIIEMIEMRERARKNNKFFQEAFQKFACVLLEKSNSEDFIPSNTSEWSLNLPLKIKKSNLNFSFFKRNIDDSSSTFFPKINPLSFTMPLYFISIRDCFAFDLVEKVTELKIGNRNITKKEYFFHPDALPSNFSHFKKDFPDYRVGVTTYENFFTHEELIDLENNTHETELKCFKGHFLPMTCQTTCTSEKVRRTKFFFGVRYMWSRLQLAEPNSYIAAGVRKDVSPPPAWMKNKVEYPLVEAGIIEKDFINSITMNIYHDGKEGLAQHFDDAVRFKQPIFTLRLFSDCRLSFGSQLYGFCNGAFTIPLPRGCVCVMEEGSYSANGIKHCIRPCDMSGKSAAIILRQIHKNVLGEASIYDEKIDLPLHFSTLSMEEDAISFNDQKRNEAEIILGNCKGK